MDNIPVLIITGPVGIGKTSVAWEISELLEDHAVSHAVIDADACYLFPRPKADPRGLNLYYNNLKSIWSNIQQEGIDRLILTKVIESQEDLDGIKKILPNTEIQVIRLQAPINIISQRLAKREIGSGYEWHLARATKFLDIWSRNTMEGKLIQADNRSVREIAQEILQVVNWI